MASASVGMRRLGLPPSKAVAHAGGWKFTELKGWRAEWNRFTPNETPAADYNILTFFKPSPVASVDAARLVGKPLRKATALLGPPYRIVGFEGRVPGVHLFEVPAKGLTVLAAPSSVAPFEDGWVEFWLPKGKAPTEASALRLIGIRAAAGRRMKNGRSFPSIPGWRVQWNAEPILTERKDGVNSLTFTKE